MFLKTGQVRKIYDASTGKRIRSLKDLEPGHNIVAASNEPFKKGNYQVENLVPVIPRQKRSYSAGRVVTFYPNGDSYHCGFNLTINRRRFTTFQRLLDHVNTQIELVTGKIQKIYSVEGERVTTLEGFEKSKGYVLVANDDPFIRTRYNILAVTYHRAQPLNGATLKNEFMQNIRPVTQRKKRRSQIKTSMHHDHERYDPADGRVSKRSTKTPGHRVPVDESGLDTDFEDNRSTVLKQQQQQQVKPKTAPKSRGQEEILEDEDIRNAKGEDEVYGDDKLKTLASKPKTPVAPAKKSAMKPAEEEPKKQAKPVEAEESKKVKPGSPFHAPKSKPTTAKRVEVEDEEFEAELLPVSKPASPPVAKKANATKPTTASGKIAAKSKPTSPEPDHEDEEDEPEPPKKSVTSKPNIKSKPTSPEPVEVPKTPKAKSKPQTPEPEKKGLVKSKSQVQAQEEEDDDNEEEEEVPKNAKSAATSRGNSAKDKNIKFKSDGKIDAALSKENSKGDIKSNPALPKSGFLN